MASESPVSTYSLGALARSRFPVDRALPSHMNRSGRREAARFLGKHLDAAFRHYRAGRRGQARETCDEVLRARLRHPDILYLRGVIAIEEGNPTAAIEFLAAAVAANPSFALYQNSLGVARRQAGRLREAMSSFLQALSLDPDDAAAGDNLVQVFRDLRQGNGAPGQAGGRAGRLVIGIGTGRCGSTSLAKLLERQPGAAVSHERPPRLPWVPKPGRLRVHLACFEELLRSHDLVADVSHWWLPYLADLFERFPTMKVVALKRDREQTVRSFEKIKGSGEGAINHWCNHDGKVWQHNPWDECYPSYDLEDRAEAIGRYWDDYYAAVEDWLRRRPGSVWCGSTDILNTEDGQNGLFDFLGIDEPILAASRYNVRTVDDGVRLWG
jgi:tetratricopeptide (TPR) repeat protein